MPHFLALLALVIPLAVGAQVLPGLFEPQSEENPVSSWPMWGATSGRTFRVEEPGHSASLEYHKWELQDGGLQLGTGTEFMGAVAGDLDGDGMEEVVAVSEPFGFENSHGKLRVWNASGTLQWSIDQLSSGGYPVLFDWDRDGDLDIQLGDGRLQQVYDGSGRLLWTMPMAGPVPCGTHCVTPLLEDLTGDGVPEVMMRTGPDQNAVFALEGTTLRVLWNYPLRCGALPIAPAIVKTPGGPRALVGCRGAEGFEYLVGPTLFGLDSKAALAPPVQQVEKAWAWNLTWVAGHDADDLTSLMAGDVDGDGAEEVVVATRGPGGIHVLTSNGTTLASLEHDSDGYAYLALAQLDSDAALEIIESVDGRVSAYDFSETGLRQLWTADLGSVYIPATPVADLDGDGLDEIVVPAQVGQWCEHEGNGFVAILNPQGGVVWTSEPTAKCVQPVRGIALADLDKDGDIEIIQPAASEFLVYGIGPQPARSRGST